MTRPRKGAPDLGQQCIICGEAVMAKELCTAHYNRQRFGKPLDTPILRRKDCDIPWCKTRTTLRYCRDHRNRQQVWGNPLASAPFTKKAEREFWAQAERRGDSLCWPWKGRVHKPNKTGAGYGIVEARDRARMGWASRTAWLLGTGREVPAGMRVTWTCGNTLCCNWRHMEPLPTGQSLRGRPGQ